jgi:hypothetical protein
LGAAYSGVCRSRAEPLVPSEEHQREFCNCGYARGLCSDFPAEAAADAVRFSAAGEAGKLVYVFEKDHAPLRHGVLELASTGGEDALLILQARAFMRSETGDSLSSASGKT